MLSSVLIAVWMAMNAIYVAGQYQLACNLISYSFLAHLRPICLRHLRLAFLREMCTQMNEWMRISYQIQCVHVHIALVHCFAVYFVCVFISICYWIFCFVCKTKHSCAIVGAYTLLLVVDGEVWLLCGFCFFFFVFLHFCRLKFSLMILIHRCRRYL